MVREVGKMAIFSSYEWFAYSSEELINAVQATAHLRCRSSPHAVDSK